MRKLFALLPFISLVHVGCGDDGVDGARMEYPPLTFTVGAGLNPVLSHSFELRDVSTEHARFTQETGTAWGEWERVLPARARLTADEAGLTWGFAFEVVVKAYRDDVRVAQEIFYRDQIRNDVGGVLDLVPSELDVQDLLSDPTVNIVVEFRRLEASPPQSIPATLTLGFAGVE